MLVQHARGEAGVRYLRREQLLLGEVLPPRPEQEREEAGDDGGDVLFGRPAQPERVHERDVVVAGERGELRAALHAASSPRVAIHGVRWRPNSFDAGHQSASSLTAGTSPEGSGRPAASSSACR